MWYLLQVKTMESSMHNLQAEYDGVKSHLKETEEELSESYAREYAAREQIKEQSEEIFNLQVNSPACRTHPSFFIIVRFSLG